MAKSFATGDTPVAIAYALLLHIANSEEKINVYGESLFIQADKAWILDTYTECLIAATGQRE